MSFTELTKGAPDDISGSLPKYLIDCQTKITEDDTTTKDWLKNISYIQTLRNSGSLVSPDRKNKQILEGILHDNARVVVKVSNNNENIEKEYENYKILIEKNVLGFLNYYCFFVCKDFIKRIRSELTDEIDDYGRKNIIPNFDKKTPSICIKDGDDMKVLIMEYVENGSFGLYDWKKDDIDIIISCIKQLICSLIDAYIKTGFVHYDLNYNNYVLKNTKNNKVVYHINDKEISIKIPANGFEIAIMDLENCEINQDAEYFIKSLNILFTSIQKIELIYVNIFKKILGDLYKILSESHILSQDKNTENITVALHTLKILELFDIK